MPGRGGSTATPFQLGMYVALNGEGLNFLFKKIILPN